MAIIVSTNGKVLINSVDLSDHCRSFVLQDGQETREITCMGSVIRTFRAGLATPSLEATFRLDHATGSVEPTLRALTTTASTGFVVSVQKNAGSATTPTATTNPLYTMTCVLDGDLTVLNEEHGEVAEVTARFVPYSGSLALTTTASC